MSDIADQAQLEQDMDRDIAIKAALKPPAGCETGPDWQEGVPLCRFCGEVIPERRLLAMPETGLCVVCAAEMQEGTVYATMQNPDCGMLSGQSPPWRLKAAAPVYEDVIVRELLPRK